MTSNNQIRSKLAVELLSFKGQAGGQPLILLRDTEGLKNGTFRDLDVFTRSFAPKQFERFVLDMGFIIVKRISRFHFFQYCLCDSKTQEFLLLDIWTKLHFKGVAYFPEEHQLKTITLESGVRALDQYSSLSVSFVKCLTQSGIVKDKYLQMAKNLGYNERDLTESSILAINTENIGSRVRNRCYWALSILKATFLKRNLLVVYLLGPDGAGKTTISDRLIAGQIRANAQYFHGRIPLLPRLSQFRSKPAPKAKFSDKVKRKFTFAHAIYYSLDSLCVRVILNLSWWKDRIIISDRTHYDIVAREDYRNVPAWIQRSLVKSIYRADAALLLTCPPAEIHARKPELSPTEIDLQYTAYESHKEILRFEPVSTHQGADSITQISRTLFNELPS